MSKPREIWWDPKRANVRRTPPVSHSQDYLVMREVTPQDGALREALEEILALHTEESNADTCCEMADIARAALNIPEGTRTDES